jgi:hypothetical protein
MLLELSADDAIRVILCGFSISRLNPHHHKMWMRIFPGKCPLPGVEKPVDDYRVPLSNGPA